VTGEVYRPVHSVVDGAFLVIAVFLFGLASISIIFMWVLVTLCLVLARTGLVQIDEALA
jgi:hypothetical protein